MGFVYLLQQASDSCFKIGSSENGVESRLVSCQIGNPKRLRIFGTIESVEYERLEDDLHKEFDRYHEGGEWFGIDAATAVKTIQSLGGKILVDDPFRFTIGTTQKILDVDEITKQIKHGFLLEAESWFDTKFESRYFKFIENFNITAEMSAAMARGRAARNNALKAFLLTFVLVSFSLSVIVFWNCFGESGDNFQSIHGEPIKEGYWDFSQKRKINFIVLEIGVFVISLGLSVYAWHENNNATESEVDWERFKSVQKKMLLKKGKS